jgi:hypothetical protein
MSDISNDRSHPASTVRFFGPDIIRGRVHSNDDIFVRRIGGGTNDGWPTFYEEVTTPGIIQDMISETAWRPFSDDETLIKQVFRGGLKQGKDGVQPIYYDPSARELRARGNWSFGTSNGYDIVFIKYDGSRGNSLVARFVDRPDTISVLNSFPDSQYPTAPFGQRLWINDIVFTDTLWTTGTSISGQTFIPNVVWIDGKVGGNVTIGTSENAFITGHIYYSGTPRGERPDGLNFLDPPGETGHTNTTDYFGLVSEKHIQIL